MSSRRPGVQAAVTGLLLATVPAGLRLLDTRIE
jgi:hypothetical protein